MVHMPRVTIAITDLAVYEWLRPDLLLIKLVLAMKHQVGRFGLIATQTSTPVYS